jgi:hypothetical protein
MKSATKQKLPPGWNEKKIRAVIAHYDQQTDEEGAAEIESASEAPGETWMAVPTELVGVVTQLIEAHQLKSAHRRTHNHAKKRGQ